MPSKISIFHLPWKLLSFDLLKKLTLHPEVLANYINTHFKTSNVLFTFLDNLEKTLIISIIYYIATTIVNCNIVHSNYKIMQHYRWCVAFLFFFLFFLLHETLTLSFLFFSYYFIFFVFGQSYMLRFSCATKHVLRWSCCFIFKHPFSRNRNWTHKGLFVI